MGKIKPCKSPWLLQMLLVVNLWATSSLPDLLACNCCQQRSLAPVTYRQLKRKQQPWQLVLCLQGMLGQQMMSHQQKLQGAISSLVQSLLMGLLQRRATALARLLTDIGSCLLDTTPPHHNDVLVIMVQYFLSAPSGPAVRTSKRTQ